MVRRNGIKSYILLLAALCVFSGCGLMDSLHKEAKEEKSILGYVKGYNPRIKEMQQILKEAGRNPGSIDGIMNKETRQAIKDFQKANQIKTTGFVDIKTQAKLDSFSLELTRKKKQDLQAKDIKKRLKSGVWIKKVQQALKNAGFDPGAIDGIMGEKTKNAIVDFQKSKGLAADAKVDVRTWDELSNYFPKEQ
ncbi:MAG: peptidoglycan-binding protein [Candidatus Omnitrophica bacterium]|nr:peptidoglycan-binding protein [Candidatus Omnitrophota bacterium]MBU4473470.1 peptidoglycan-binding protein [Candidatus Omnitrophota bacterium]MCG2706195.1 peptidoglycan-binding protein [Candidatus Omnitrophota bacterium]